MLGTPHLTTAHAPDLAACISQTEPGQASWAGWHAPQGKTCVECRHFEKERRKRLLHDLEGRCAKHRSLTRRQGLKFSAQCRACQYFEELCCMVAAKATPHA